MRRPIAIAALAALLTLTLASVPFVSAKRGSCQVTNEAGGKGHKGDLQAALDAAAPGATLVIRGTCVGNFTLTKDVTLLGKAYPGFGRANSDRGAATLDGNGSGSVLTVEDSGATAITISDLTITGGSAPMGGGIRWLVGPSMTLINTIVTGNSAGIGGGIAAYPASYGGFRSITLINSSVTNNTASERGGGIAVGVLAIVVLQASSVDLNTAATAGGVLIDVRGQLFLDERSTIGDNAATAGDGGGIVVVDSNPYGAIHGSVTAGTFSPSNSPDQCVTVYPYYYPSGPEGGCVYYPPGIGSPLPI